eukprot:TRINITY_DN32017_c0_g1_i1.p1 TRINITY_DN32017_c0_g1~~TRINITY_DN32017_c0_g1_i1.p1  ORF type:complete len:599 (+),score=120.84 TRINITY_DN32017_c0_g1_i1:71-1798(+)
MAVPSKLVVGFALLCGLAGGSTTPFPTTYAAYAPPSPQAVAPQQGIDSTANLIAMSQRTASIVGGLTESFLGGSQAALTPKELQCLSDGASKLAGGMLDTAGRTAQTFKAFSAQAKAAKALQQAQMTPQMAQAYPGMVQSPAMAAPMAPMGAPMGTPMGQTPNPVDPLVAGLEISMRISRMMELENKVAEKCLHHDVKKAMKHASENLRNMSYVGGHLIANGVDIVTELTQAVEAYEKGDYRAFGDNFGMAARKTLLSKESDHLNKLMRIPTEADIEDVTKGLVSSMFGQGMTMEVWTDPVTTMAPPPPMYFMQPTAAPGPNGQVQYLPTQAPPAVVPWVLLPASDVKVDLHTCLEGNKELFKTAWDPVFKVMSQMASAGTADGASILETSAATGSKGMGALAMSMLDMQIALRRCGFTAEQEAILWDAMEAGKGWHMKIHTPDKDATGKDIKKNMELAVSEWEDQDYSGFGQRLGVALREMAMKAFPEKYYVDSTGKLRRQLGDLADAAQADGIRVLSMGALGGCLLAFSALLALRGRRLAATFFASPRGEGDVEAESFLRDPDVAAEAGTVFE